MLKRNQGFTLIELLVVIAIIGILSSVVLASLNTARNKGTDAKVKANLSGLRTAAEIYYDNNGGNYGTATAACTGGMFADSGSGMTQYIAGIPNATCRSSGTAYAVSAPLTSATDVNADNWCVDSVGNSKAIAAALGTGIYVCP